MSLYKVLFWLMKCPSCTHPEDKVLDTRVQRGGQSIRRRRECLKCHFRFTTEEGVVAAFPLVIKKDGRREAFSKDKMLAGIQIACQKRPVSHEQMQDLVERTVKWITDHFDSEVPSKVIGEKLMREMMRLDDVAYVRFASVYRQFKDLEEFLKELEHTKNKDSDESPPFQLTPPPSN